MNGRGQENGPGAAATAHRAGGVDSKKPTSPTNAKVPANDTLFEVPYRDRLWRLGLSEYGGETRISVWAHYQDRKTGEWKPCGGKCRCGTKHEPPGFIVPLDRLPELYGAVGALLLQSLPEGRSEAA